MSNNNPESFSTTILEARIPAFKFKEESKQYPQILKRISPLIKCVYIMHMCSDCIGIIMLTSHTFFLRKLVNKTSRYMKVSMENGISMIYEELP